MSLSINQVVNAQIAPVPMAAARRDLSMAALFTPETGQAFTDGQTRYVTVSSAQDVANLFGSGSSVYKAAQALFSVRPKPNKAIVARWAKEKQVIPAVASALKGCTLSVGTDTFKRIIDGAFSLMVDGKAVVIGSLDFSSAADLQGVASIIAEAIPKDAVFSSLWDDIGKRIIFQAKKAGAQGAPTFGYAIKPDAGTAAASSERLDIHTALPGRVVALNATDNTVTVEPMIKQVLVSGEPVDLPPLVDVPVHFPRGGGFAFTVPIVAGDEGLIVFGERCIDGWFASGDRSAPLDARLHDYSDGFFIPGVSSRPNAIPDLYQGGASMQTVDGETYIRLSKGKISIKGDIEHIGNSKQTGDHEQAGDFNQTAGNSQSSGTVSAQKVVANGVDTETHTHSGVQTGSGSTVKPNR